MQRQVEHLKETKYDLLIVGGGITGAGVALDAVLRGFRVGLIDKGDFASGTSSVSSKLVHGGLRYLEHGDFRLVYEALHERRLLLNNAPHLVHPLRFVIPFYQGARVAFWKWRAGLTLYDLLAGKSNLRRSRPLPTLRLKVEFPGLEPRGLQGGAEYFDAQMDDARLCLEVLQAASLRGAILANYVEATGFERFNGLISGVQAIDRTTGNPFVIRARQILNATGPWVDHICRLAGDEGGPYLQPSKGVHLVVPDQGTKTAFLLLHPADGRIFFVLPWQGKTLIGTTDTLCEMSSELLRATSEDINYLLTGFNRYFTPGLTESDVINTFVGLRPLLHAKANDPSSLSREFRIWKSPSGLLSVAGGKYTTYRAMAEAVTDQVAQALGSKRRCRTRQCKLDGAPLEPLPVFEAGEPILLSRDHGLTLEKAKHLVRRYGRRAANVAAYLQEAPSLAEPIVEGEPDLQVELAYQRDFEMALFPADHYLRRTRLGLFRPEILKTSADATT